MNNLEEPTPSAYKLCLVLGVPLPLESELVKLPEQLDMDSLVSLFTEIIMITAPIWYDHNTLGMEI
jgi:hypothetical protein